MDPNANGPVNPGATPPPPPPPAWGATPPPAAPPAWGVSAPSSSAGGVGAAVGGAAKNIVLRIVGIVLVAAVIGGGFFVYKMVLNPDHLGQVLFTTTNTNSSSNCSITNQVTTVKVGTPVYALDMLKHQVAADTEITEEHFKDGVSLGVDSYKATGVGKADCLTDDYDLSQDFTTPGVYEIQLRIGTEVISEGKLTVTP
jgi:hypothetical protein